MIVYVSTDVETDGQVVGVNSMLSLGSAAFAEDGTLLSCFSANLQPEKGGAQDPACMADFWPSTPRSGQPLARALARSKT